MAGELTNMLSFESLGILQKQAASNLCNFVCTEVSVVIV